MQNISGDKSEGGKNCGSTIGATNKPNFIQEVTLQFLVDLTWNDPIVI